MTIDSRAVALQGVGFTPRLVALQGFGALPQPAQRPEVIPGFSRRYAPAKKRKDTDDDVLMAFLLH